MSALDPKVLFTLIARHLPSELHDHVVIVGSLAAAYFHRDQLETGAVNTKDVDAMVRPAGAVAECAKIAVRLLHDGWRRAPGKCYPMDKPEPADSLRAIRLLPPKSDAYYIELLGLPEQGQNEVKKWTPVKLDDGWYGLPCFRYLGLTGYDARRSEEGLWYAIPATMALANLLAHLEVGTETMSEPIGGRKLPRSAKDLGRVLALAWLAEAEGLEQWVELWRTALSTSFPAEHEQLALRAGDGLRALLDDPDALEQARHANDFGLLRGLGVGVEKLRATGDRVIGFAVEPLAK